MSYLQHKPFEQANEHLIFHTAEPAERWAFPRAQLIYAARAGTQHQFQFPVHHVRCECNRPEALEHVLESGLRTLFSEVTSDARIHVQFYVSALKVESAYPDLTRQAKS